MEKKECFGSIQEVVSGDDMTMIQATFGCRECLQFRECLQYAKDQEELRKQNMIAKSIDLSEIHSNEIGACLLEILSRIYSSPVGSALFNTLLLFYEVSRDASSFILNIPLSASTLKVINGGEEEFSKDGFTLRIVLIQRQFPGLRKANMGFIAHEVARALASDESGVKQILDCLSDAEATKFRKLDLKLRTSWLVKKWGFQDEVEAFQKEVEHPEEKK
jgi:hypothetical protein